MGTEVFVIARGMYHRCDFTYYEDEQGRASYLVAVESATNVHMEQQFVWNEHEQSWRCRYPDQTIPELSTPIIEKIEQMEKIRQSLQKVKSLNNQNQ